MTIDYSRLRSVTARRLVSALEADGFTLRKAATDTTVTPMDARDVSFHHSSDTFRAGTLKSMIETQACWTEEDLFRLGLLS
jgi:predicted RNA binding protein YcfA (HicA-like mRNA interferase family)